METIVTVNPSAAATLALSEGINLNNEAQRLVREGNFQAAELKHLRAIELKERGLGLDHITTALSWNAIGELYIKMGRLDEAEGYLQKALRVRSNSGPASDAAATRDNLARIYEIRGNLQAAKTMRLAGAPDKIACCNFRCIHQTMSLKDLSHCSICKSIYYCSESCQVADWKRHKKYCASIPETPVMAKA
ncbi:hypothetical protein A0H81_01107 [Grifola frondosa]|uniref:MYND-type domain-containing protein n=1 Tax=Grifola frondosa TaxID=5627 RepID=A0A1C7MQ33_GRIFR|nr:hypothetical protein A0H81_01107 [Grifola frondosa]